MVMTVGEIDVGVLEKCGGGQHDIREVGGIGLKLFQHHGE